MIIWQLKNVIKSRINSGKTIVLLGPKIYAYEFKWNVKAKAKFSKSFTQAYQPEQQIVNKDNFEQFLM